MGFNAWGTGFGKSIGRSILISLKLIKNIQLLVYPNRTPELEPKHSKNVTLIKIQDIFFTISAIKELEQSGLYIERLTRPVGLELPNGGKSS